MDPAMENSDTTLFVFDFVVIVSVTYSDYILPDGLQW